MEPEEGLWPRLLTICFSFSAASSLILAPSIFTGAATDTCFFILRFFLGPGAANPAVDGGFATVTGTFMADAVFSTSLMDGWGDQLCGW